MLNKQVILLILISFIDTDVSARGSWVWEEAGVPMYPSGRPPYPITCNHCRSRGSNSGHSDEKRVHCLLRYLDTNLTLDPCCWDILPWTLSCCWDRCWSPPSSQTRGLCRADAWVPSSRKWPYWGPALPPTELRRLVTETLFLSFLSKEW